VSALRNAIALRSPAGTIVHSDRESQPRLNQSSKAVRHRAPVNAVAVPCGWHTTSWPSSPQRTPVGADGRVHDGVLENGVPVETRTCAASSDRRRRTPRRAIPALQGPRWAPRPCSC
jgi:hypothetical protein